MDAPPFGAEIADGILIVLSDGALGMTNDEDQFLRDEEGRFTAETLFGEATDENLEKVKRGNGMIVNFQRGKGEVFHAGSCEWVAGLLRRDAMVERVTSNVLDRYLGRGR